MWAALQFILQFPNSGDCFPEEVPTPFVVENPLGGHAGLVAREAPEALGVVGLFNPGNVDECLNRIMHGEPKPHFTKAAPSPIHGNGLIAAEPLPINTSVASLPFEGGSPLAVLLAAPTPTAGGVNHSSNPTTYVDRNRQVRTFVPLAEGQEITVNYSLLANDPACDYGLTMEGGVGPANTLDAGLRSPRTP